MGNLIQQQQVQGLQATIAGLPTDSRLNTTGTNLQNNLIATGTTLSGVILGVQTNLTASGYNLLQETILNSGNLVATGQTLSGSIGLVQNNLDTTGTYIISASGNLQAAIRNTGLNILTDTSTRSGNLQSNIYTNTSQIAVVSGIAVGATGNSSFNRNLITGSNARTSSNEVFMVNVSGLTVINSGLVTALSGNLSGIENALTGHIDASGNAISGTLNVRLMATGASLSGLASETRLYQTGTIANRLGPLNDNRAATLGYTNYSATSYGETMINAGATQVTATRVLQWGGDMGPYVTGELFLARSAGKRAYVPQDRTWFVKMYGSIKDISYQHNRANSIYSNIGFESGFVIDHESQEGTTEIVVGMAGEMTETWLGDWAGSYLASGANMVTFSTGNVLGISGVNPLGVTLRFRATAIVTEFDNTNLI